MAISYDPNYILAASDTLDYAEEIRAEEQTMNEETRALLASICASVEGVCEDIALDLSDSLADLSEAYDALDL